MNFFFFSFQGRGNITMKLINFEAPADTTNIWRAFYLKKTEEELCVAKLQSKHLSALG